MTPDPNEHGALKGYPDTVSDRAAIIEYEANVPRAEAERLAIEQHKKQLTQKPIPDTVEKSY